MPGAYPEEMVNSQEKLDHFWNLRLGAMVLVIAALAFWVGVAPQTVFEKILAIGVIVYVLRGCMRLIFLHNIFGRLMRLVMGPYTPDEK